MSVPCIEELPDQERRAIAIEQAIAAGAERLGSSPQDRNTAIEHAQQAWHRGASAAAAVARGMAHLSQHTSARDRWMAP